MCSLNNNKWLSIFFILVLINRLRKDIKNLFSRIETSCYIFRNIRKRIVKENGCFIEHVFPKSTAREATTRPTAPSGLGRLRYFFGNSSWFIRLNITDQRIFTQEFTTVFLKHRYPNSYFLIQLQLIRLKIVFEREYEQSIH